MPALGSFNLAQDGRERGGLTEKWWRFAWHYRAALDITCHRVVAAELAGTTGKLTVDRVALELSVMPDVSPELPGKIVKHLAAAMARP